MTNEDNYMQNHTLLDVDPNVGIEALDDLKAISTILIAFSNLSDKQRKSLPNMENFYRFIAKFLDEPLRDIWLLSKLGNKTLIELQKDILRKEAIAKKEAKAKKKATTNYKTDSKS